MITDYATHSVPSKKIKNLSESLNTIGLLGINLALLVAFYYQFFGHELPCPLCLLQRIGLMAIGIGFLMNLRFGVSFSYYGLAIISAVVSGIISMRQVLLHIVPGTGNYGSALFGIHLYTWGLLAAFGVIIFIAALLILEYFRISTNRASSISIFGRISIGLFSLLVAMNLVSSFFVSE